MIRWNAIIIGCIMVIVLKSIGSTTGVVGADFGVIIAGGLIGYLVDRYIIICSIHGVLIGILGAAILSLIDLINLHIYGLTTPVSLTFFTSIFTSAIFGAAGAVLFQYLEKLTDICK